MVLVLMGVLLAGGGCVGLVAYKQFFKRAIVVPGLITGCKSYQQQDMDTSNTTTMYHTVATFEFDGQTRTVTSRSASSVKPKIGKQVQVGVNPSNIQEARIYSKSSVIILWIFIALGLATTLLGVAEMYDKI